MTTGVNSRLVPYRLMRIQSAAQLISFMKTLASKKNHKAQIKKRLVGYEKPGATLPAKRFCFAPDAVGMVKGPKDLSSREGLVP